MGARRTRSTPGRIVAIRTPNPADAVEQADFRFAASVAAFGLILRGSQYRGIATLTTVEQAAASALDFDPNGNRAEFLDLVRKARKGARSSKLGE